MDTDKKEILMGKREKHFEKVAEYKARFESLPTEKLRERLNFGRLIKEAAIAYRELIAEREMAGDDVKESNVENLS